MSKHPNLSELDYLFEKGTDFRLSDRLYQEKTGAALPKEKSYIKHSSALAKWANEKGYYIEEVENVAKIENIRYILCSSTLLEGVNMPFTTMFILDLYKGQKYLTYHQLVNLIGRVNRFNIIFGGNKDGLKGILSNIYFLKRNNERKNYKKFISERLKIESNSEKRNDQVENPFLKESKNKVEEIEKNVLSVLLDEPVDGQKAKFKTNIGKIMMDQNIIDLDLFKYEETIQKRIDSYNEQNEELIEKIYNLFIKDLPYKDKSKANELNDEGARHHYSMVLKWRKLNQSFSQMINKQIYYWNNSDKEDIYVGERWGEPKSYNYKNPYINKTRLNKKQLTNLAIIKVKDDLDYLDFCLLRYIEVLNKIGFIDDHEYNLIKFGTTNSIQIFFLKEGLSQDLSKLIVNKYNNYIIQKGNTYKLNEKILSDMKNENENEILVNELSYYIY